MKLDLRADEGYPFSVVWTHIKYLLARKYATTEIHLLDFEKGEGTVRPFDNGLKVARNCLILSGA